MSQDLSSIKDHWLLTILSIFGMGFGTSWFLAQVIFVSPAEEVMKLQREVATLQTIIAENKRTTEQLNQSFEEAVREKRNLQAEIVGLRDDLQREKADRIALK